MGKKLKREMKMNKKEMAKKEKIKKIKINEKE